MIQIGNDKIKDIYVGSDKIKEVYCGSEKVWGEIESIQDGYWVHKDTGVKTYFGLDDSSIEGGIMGYPSWMPNCSEVKLPSGVTGFKTYNWVIEEWGNEEVTYIGFVHSKETYAAEGNEVLIGVDLSNTSITSIGTECFYLCSSLTSITLPESVVSLSDSCFYGCYALTSINIPEGVTSLGEYCFSECTSLTSINIPEGVTSLGEYCFYGCTSLILATVLPVTPPTLGWGIFDYVHTSFNIKVHSPYVDDYKTNWTYYADIISAIEESTNDGYWVHKDTGVKTYFDADADFITNGVMSSPPWGDDCSEVKLPSGVTGLSPYCFYNCTSLTSITLPGSVTSLGEGCFYNCTSLTSITLPESVTSLGGSCFNQCYALTLATVLPVTPPTLGSAAFDSVHTSFNIKVRSPYVDDYKTNWIDYASIISAI